MKHDMPLNLHTPHSQTHYFYHHSSPDRICQQDRQLYLNLLTFTLFHYCTLCKFTIDKIIKTTHEPRASTDCITLS